MLKKNVFYIIIFCFLIFSACDNNTTDEVTANSSKTKVQFKNLEQFPVTVYLDPNRQTVYTNVPKLDSETVSAAPDQMGIAFYPTFHLDLFEIPGISIPYNGPAFIAAIQPDITNIINIPKLEQIEINNSYIKIINNSNFPLSLRQGSTERSPIDSTSSIILPSQSTVYELLPGVVSSYSIMRNTTIPIDFPPELNELERGIIYVLTYDGTSLKLTKLISLIQTIPPETPANLNLTILSNTSAEITWNASYGATSYNIYRASGSSTSPYNLIAATTTPLYAITNLVNGQVYYYKISALSGIRSESNYSSEVFIITPPVNIRASCSTVNITLEWDVYNGVDSFNIYRSSGENDDYNIINTGTVTGRVFTDTSVSLETDYYYKISAKISDIEGLLSSALSAATLSTIPTNVHVTSRSTIGINLAWDNINGTSGYNIYRSNSENGAFSLLNSSLLSGASYSDINVIPDTTYYYKVSSVNNNVESFQSDTITTSTLSPVPDNVRSTDNNISSITLVWDSVSEASYYNIYRSVNENGSFSKINSSSVLSTEYTDTEVTPYTAYFYKVSAVIADIERAQSVFASANTGLIVTGSSLAEKLSWLQENAVSNSYYSIVLDTDEYIGSNTLSYSGASGITINLTGDGTMRNINFLSQGSLFTITSGVTLILDNNITLCGSSTNNDSLITIGRNGNLLMNDNTFITGNSTNSSYGGGGVYCWGNFTMNGGKIINNSAINNDTDGGGGVIVVGTTTIKGVFTMNDGEISGNSSASGGGGVSIDGGIFTMNGGVISGNSANSGGGVYIYNYYGGTVTMNGGVISNNVSNSNGNFGGGGGVYIYYGSFTMNSGTISGNVSNSVGFFGGGGGVFISQGNFIMKGGEISGNTHMGSGTLNGGGGVAFTNSEDNRNYFRMSGGVIYGNNAASVLKNNAGTGVALYYYDGYDNRSAAQYGTFNGDTFSRRGYLNTTNDTIRIVNGSLLTY
jgi:fibronectin type 3 domain-containing protein